MVCIIPTYVARFPESLTRGYRMTTILKRDLVEALKTRRAGTVPGDYVV